MIKIFNTTEDHIRELSLNIRDGDKKECLDIYGEQPYHVISSSFIMSYETYTGWDDGVLGIVGVVHPSLLGEAATPWLLTSNLLTKKPRHLLKFTKPFIQRWLDMWPVLENYIDAEYTAALRWAKWSGFTIHEPTPYGVKKIPCCKIEIRRN